MEDALWTPDETARHLAISIRTLNKLSGIDLPFIWVGGQRRFDPEEVRLYKERQRRGQSLKTAGATQ